MFCTFVFTASCKADHCCWTQGLFGGGKWWWHSRCNWSPCKQHHVFLTLSDELSSWVDQTSCAEEDQVLLFPVYWWCPHQRESWRFSQERIEALLEEQDISHNSRVQFGLHFTSMIPRIHNSILVDFLDESHRLLLQYVRRSDLIKLQETQQPQPYHLPHPSHQQPFVKSTGPQVSAYPVSPLLSSSASQHHWSPTCGIASASSDSFTQQHMYSDHFLLFYFLYYSNLWWHLRPFSEPGLSRRATAGDASDTFHFLPVWRECEPEHSSTWRSKQQGLVILSSHLITFHRVLFRTDQILQKWVIKLRWQISVSCSNPSSKPQNIYCQNCIISNSPKH